MNSPYEGKFKVSQQYKPGVHDGLDLVGIDHKEIHSCANAKVIHVGWENPNNHSQGFGYYVATEDTVAGPDGIHKIRYYGHLTENSAKVKVGDVVKTTDVLGVEGYTGYVIPSGPGGAHCHYEIRSAFYKGARVYNVSTDAGIPNKSACIHVFIRIATTTVLVDIRPYGHVPRCLNHNLTSE